MGDQAGDRGDTVPIGSDELARPTPPGPLAYAAADGSGARPAGASAPGGPAPAADPETHLPQDFGTGTRAHVLFWIAASFAAFQVVTAFGIPLDVPLLPGVTAINVAAALLAAALVRIAVHAARGRPVLRPLVAFAAMAATWAIIARYPGGVPSQVLRAMHVGYLGLLTAGMLTGRAGTDRWLQAALWIGGIAMFATGLYHWAFFVDLVQRSGELTALDRVIGLATIGLLMWLAWRAMGVALPIVAGIFLAYCLLGQYLPRGFDHRGYDLDQVIDTMVFGTEGIYGTPTLVSATYIFLFILFGSFMERAGVIDFFNDVSMALFGRARGGPAKVCIASSALMGTVSGSGVANVVASGQFTIPLMKRFGFTSAFAGGVEATSSMGGQIMPPVMGAVAFIMAETIGVPYADIVQAAIIPAVLYFTACYCSVHLEAGRLGLSGLPADQLPSLRRTLAERWFLILPLAALVAILFGGFTPLFAGAVGLALTAVMIIGAALAAGLVRPVIRLVFWIGLAFASAASMWVSVTAVTLVVLALVVAGLFTARSREALEGCLDALAHGARQALPVGLACAVVGIVIGTMTLTGLGTIVGNTIITIGRDSVATTLCLTMIFSLILGMGIPTIPNYIITSSLAAPILLKLGVPLIVSHMFVFYFGIMADLTPPVALAAFAAAPMAKESGLKIGVQAVRIALPGFIIPYIAVYNPELMLQTVAGLDGAAYAAAVVWVTVKATLAIGLWGMAAFGFGLGRASAPERLVAFAAAIALVYPSFASDLVGVGLSGALAAWHVAAQRRLAATAR
jgi:TRAP transporter 4TM/12TM fusion protein